ncbi:hypothetical protein FH972_023040 [Carpinus fangiana]|uniref:Uncharacterized protein n=1 Tax=Carpinus fangiana TaxID=176857 RepID=A0A5N6KUM4_9ROSI|nr:hypothetical protein FH972_023040 [Carpinus fangiana]
MRVTASHLPDFDVLHPDLSWGKWNCSLDLRQEGDREKLKALIMEADVVISGYRPGVMEKWGFGPEDVLEMTKDRESGIIVARENCYGWHGPWKDRSGWQQISDTINRYHSTGINGFCGIVDAILRRGEIGGSYLVDVRKHLSNPALSLLIPNRLP